MIVNIIPKKVWYQLSPIEEMTIKYDLGDMLLRVNHRSEKSNLGVSVLEKLMDKEV